MEKGQGSLEYLLILAAILAIAVVVIVVANSMLSTPQTTAQLTKDNYEASVAGAELIGYERPFDGTVATAPASIKYKDVAYSNPAEITLTVFSQYSATRLFSLNSHNVYYGTSGSEDAIILAKSPAEQGSIFSNGMKSPAFGSPPGGDSTNPPPSHIRYTRT